MPLEFGFGHGSCHTDRMKEVFLDEKLSDKSLKARFVSAEKSSGPVEICEHETSCTFAEEIEEGVSIAQGLCLLSGFVETVASVEKNCVTVAPNVAYFAKCTTVLSSAL